MAILFNTVAVQDARRIGETTLQMFIFASIHVAISSAFTLVISFGAALYWSLPVRLFLHARISLIVQANIFLQMDETKVFFSGLKTIFTRDGPFDGLPGGEVSHLFVSGLMLILYVVFSYSFYNVGAVLSALLYYKMWILGTPIVVIFLALAYLEYARRRGRDEISGNWLEYTVLIILKIPVKACFFLYRLPSLARHVTGRIFSVIYAICGSTFEQLRMYNPSTLYTYEPLRKENEIRLVKLDRRLPGMEISCHLEHIPLDQAPSYEAVSYTWGSSIKDHLVFFDGKWLPTTRNVYKLLHDRSSYTKTRWLWIDAISINQDDLDEKNFQVELMGKIYQSAERTFVWLEDRKVSESSATDALFLLELINYNYFLMEPERYKTHTHIIGEHRQWLALNDLLSHPYWYRVWIIQEIAMGKAVHVRYGGKYIAWDHLQEMASVLCQNPINIAVANAQTAFSLKNSKIMAGSTQIRNIGKFRKHVAEDTSGIFIHCVPLTINCAATNPRDRIFAFRNLVKWSDRTAASLDNKVDYKLATHQVYTNAMRYFVPLDPHSALSRSGIGWHRKTPGLPSWVTDFDMFPLMVDEPSMDEDVRYRAGGNHIMSVHVADSMSETVPSITLKAVFVTEVSILSSAIPILNIFNMDMSSKSWDDTFSPSLNEMWSMKSELPSRYKATGQPTEEAFWRTMIGDRCAVGDTNPTRFQFPAPEEFSHYFAIGWEIMCTGGKDPMAGMFEDDDEKKKRWDALRFQCNFQFSRAFSGICPGRRFAITTSGLMGLVPPNTEPGDILCLIPGFECPVLLRKASSPLRILTDEPLYRYVGVCYMHGLMLGEGLKDNPVPETCVVF
jgi:hypothetical protein